MEIVGSICWFWGMGKLMIGDCIGRYEKGIFVVFIGDGSCGIGMEYYVF